MARLCQYLTKTIFLGTRSSERHYSPQRSSKWGAPHTCSFWSCSDSISSTHSLNGMSQSSRILPCVPRSAFMHCSRCFRLRLVPFATSSSIFETIWGSEEDREQHTCVNVTQKNPPQPQRHRRQQPNDSAVLFYFLADRINLLLSAFNFLSTFLISSAAGNASGTIPLFNNVSRTLRLFFSCSWVMGVSPSSATSAQLPPH